MRLAVVLSSLASPDLTEDQGEGGHRVLHSKLGLYQGLHQRPQRSHSRLDLLSVQLEDFHIVVIGELAGVKIQSSKDRLISQPCAVKKGLEQITYNGVIGLGLFVITSS